MRYIRESPNRVKVFLVIVPDVDKEAENQAVQLKKRNETDTDIALITARDLKYLAEKWPEFSKSKNFDLNIFNITKILDRNELDKRMNLFLN